MTLGPECYAPGIAVPSRSVTSDDCNDLDVSVHTPGVFFRDQDGDGVSSPGESLCASTPPEGYSTVVMPGPSIAFAAGTIVSAPYAGMDRANSWNNPEDAAASDGNSAQCQPRDLAGNNGKDTCELLVIYGFRPRVPSTAVIRGIRVHIRKSSEPPNGNGVLDTFVLIMKDVTQGSATSENKALTTVVWPEIPVDQVYGGPTDLWGTTWTAAELNNPMLGIVVGIQPLMDGNTAAARVDHVWLEVFHDQGGTDCAPVDASAYTTWEGWPDSDHDGFGAGVLSQSCAGTTAPSMADRDGDCDDADARAQPGRTNYYSSPRMGVGGFDFNCDGTVTKNNVVTHTACTDNLTSCSTASTSSRIPSESCGSSTTVQRCPAAPPCTPMDTTVTVTCH